MRLASIAVACILTLVARMPAQQQRIRRLESALARSEVGSAPWYHRSLDLIDAWRCVDLRESAARAQDLWRYANEHGQGDAAAAAAASAAFALTLSEGVAPSKQWLDRAVDPGEQADPRLRALALLMRARTLCVMGRHAEEVPLAIGSERGFRQAHDWYYQIVVAMFTVHAIPGRGLAGVEKLMAQARDAGIGEQIEDLQLPFALLQAQVALDREDHAMAREALRRAEPMCDESGDLCGRAALHMIRFDLCMATDQKAQAALQLAQAGEHYARLRNAIELVRTFDLRARLAIEGGETERARELIERERAIMRGRGWVDREAALLETRFLLALKEGDAALAERLQTELAAVMQREGREMTRYMDVTEKLVEAEQANLEYESELKQKELELATYSRSIWMWSALGGGVALVSLLAISWLSRRRQAAANRALADKVRELEEAKGARRELEVRMQQLERTEGLGTLAAGIAHDFNNLLTSIIGGAELLRAHATDRADRDLAEMVLSAGQQGSRLCRQLQSYSGGMPLMREAFDVHQVVREMLPTLAASVKDRLAIHVEPAEGPVVIYADRAQFEQILLNLVQNSHEAGATSVSIAMARTEVSANDGTRRTVAELEIVDDGTGMDEKVQKRIFDPFFTTRFPGRGLGLAVVFGGVRRHGGEVFVDSEPGRGTRFRIQLPLAEDIVELPSKPPATDTDVVPVPIDAEVIVVDDEAIVRRALAGLLQSLGVEAHAFADGQQALDFVNALPAARPVVAFVDLTMPGDDGAEVVRRLRAQERPLRTVLMSGHTDDYLRQSSQAAAADRLLAKPFSADDVRSLLRDLGDSLHAVP